MQRLNGDNLPPVPCRSKVLVVGTTADYIDWIQRACPGEALFLTDPEVRRGAVEVTPAPEEELLCDLTDFRQARILLEQHLSRHHLDLEGVACFDCESMELAARLADHFAFAYPSVQAVGNCRDKLRTKALWHRHLLDTPLGEPIETTAEAIHFLRKTGGPIVLKPSSGSGSELVFACADEAACRYAYAQIRDGLKKRRGHRLYANKADSAPCIMAEERVDGQEFSCDFALDEGQVHLIRLTRKIKAQHGPFGTIAGYLLPARLPEAVDAAIFQRTLLQSAVALGIDRAICMLDFMIQGDQIILLELAPRPGGDCLPFLLRRRYRLDIIKLQLDFACRKAVFIEHPQNGAPLAAVRLFASHSGELKQVDARSLEADARIKEIHLLRKPGHRIVMPPKDYDSWLLGHIIFVPDDMGDVDGQAAAILDRVRVEVT